MADFRDDFGLLMVGLAWPMVNEVEPPLLL